MTEEAEDNAMDSWEVRWRHRLDWQKILNISEVVRVLASRCCFFWNLSRYFGKPKPSVPKSASVGSSGKPLFGGSAWKGCCLILDLVLGRCLVSWIMQDGGIHCNNLLGSCLQMLRSGVFNLTGVIDWLMNNPAGLKLNKELAHTLGAFFKHHISLWQSTFCAPGRRSMVIIAKRSERVFKDSFSERLFLEDENRRSGR
ncbi:hypothetical protein RvY_06105-3 [Ramazzottius varieornatus]|uniref:Uncharacterized protein n=1 Tax=Ramazzottius varieornatus TaxID=947166 RepID=A0A1D1UXF3_RAMVA|nr:hypothetical protein RvY_06105-3 [Ramazzottius varieornatus]